MDMNSMQYNRIQGKRYPGDEMFQQMQYGGVENRGDTVLRMFLQNEHRDRIKQIYAQTGKILEETLSYPDGSSNGVGPLSYS